MRIRALNTEGFRIAAIFVGIFAMAAFSLTLVTILIVEQELRGQIVQFAEADIAAVKDGYRTEGVREAREVIGQRMAAPGASDFFLLERKGERLAGNMAAMTARAGILTLRDPLGRRGHAILGAGEFVGPDLYVFSGSDLFSARQARGRILRTLIWVFAGALIAASLCGMTVSRSFLNRADVIATTCRAIMAGDFATRIPVRGTDDELDRVSQAINAMLDRIVALMENLRQVTNDVAHDLRTPVTHLRHRLERARADAVTTQDYDRALEGATAATDDILALFAALLRIAQIEGGARRAAFATIELKPLLQQLRDTFAPVAEDARHHLTLRMEGEARVAGDRTLLIQLFSNLIENAILHTPEGTHVVLELARQDGDVRISVRDNGPGVPPEEHDKLFRRLYRREASRTSPGYGLGLALVAAIAELHGGRITIDRQEGPGLCISLIMPAAHASMV